MLQNRNYKQLHTALDMIPGDILIRHD